MYTELFATLTEYKTYISTLQKLKCIDYVEKDIKHFLKAIFP